MDDSQRRGRLDITLVARGLAPTRARARDAILRGAVTVDGRPERRPALPVPADARIAIDDPAVTYVSRGSLKLTAALDAFGFSPKGLVVLDIGASTGGFTQVLLERGAARVHAIDVGRGQLDPKLAADPRVKSQEGLNARELGPGDIGEAVDAIVADVSFISLRLALPPGLALASRGAWGVFLVKPQFEAGRHAVGKGGVVRDAGVAAAAASSVGEWLEREMGWRLVGVIPSPIAGGDGNREFLVGARRA